VNAPFRTTSSTVASGTPRLGATITSSPFGSTRRCSALSDSADCAASGASGAIVRRSAAARRRTARVARLAVVGGAGLITRIYESVPFK
jgi:hypothetical protein